MARLGPYELLGELGRGAMGVVHRARHAALDHIVALKVVAPGSASPMAIARLRREAQAAARLAEVEGVVAVRDVGEAGGRVYIAMDFVDGRPFDAVIAEGELSVAACIGVVARAARAVQAAHDHGVLHRDLKPANILIDRDGAPWVADFGLAQMVPADADVTKLTRSDEILGTPAYMPPEQVLGGTGQHGLSPASDVYALGATLYQAVTGRLPFVADSVFGLFMQVLREPPQRPSSFDQPLPPGLEEVLLAALAKQPAERPQTAGAFADELDRVLAGEAVHSTAPRAPGRRRAGWIAAAAALFAVSVGGLAWSLAGRSSALTQAERAAARAQLAADLPQIYRQLLQRSGAAMATLEDAWNRVPVPPQETAAALAAVRAAAQQVDDGRPALRLPRAWIALAEAYAGAEYDDTRPLEALGGGDDPYPTLFAARLVLGAMAHEIEAPEFRLSEAGYTTVTTPPGERETALRDRAARLIDGLQGSPVLASLPDAGNYRELLAAGAAFAAGRYGDAVPRLRPLREDPLLAGVAIPMLGLALLHTGHAAEAAGVLEDERVRDWQAIQHNAVLAHCAAAGQASARGADPVPALNRARERAEHLVALGPDRPAWRKARLQVWFLRARQAALIPALTPEDYAAVERDLQALEPHPGEAAGVAEWRVELHLLYLQLPGIAPAPPAELERRAVAALAAWEQASPADAAVPAERARLWEIRTALAEAAGEPVLPHLRRAAEAWDQAVVLDPSQPTPLGRAGVAWVHAGQGAEAAGDPDAAAAAYARALELCNRWLRVEPGSSEPLVNRGVVHRLRGDLAAARGGDGAPHHRAAVEDGRASVQLAPDDWQALYNLGLAEAKLRNWAAAEAAFARALEQAPGNAQITDLLGQVRRILGK